MMRSEPYILSGLNGQNFYYCFSLLDFDDLPILFVALDETRAIYLCDCTEFRFGIQKWTIAESNPQIVKSVINGTISVDKALGMVSDNVILAECDLETDVYVQKNVKIGDVDSSRLPKTNTILSCPCEDAMYELIQLEIELHMQYEGTVVINMPDMMPGTILFSQIVINTKATQIYLDDEGNQTQKSASFNKEKEDFDSNYRGDAAA